MNVVPFCTTATHWLTALTPKEVTSVTAPAVIMEMELTVKVLLEYSI